MITVHSGLTESEWLDLRKRNVNSTESAALFGLSPYCTELELFINKRDGIEAFPFQDNERTEIGRELEPGIAAIAARKLECNVAPFKDYLCDEEQRIGSSFDYRITSGEYEGWLIEIKNVDYLVHRDKWLDDEAPEHIEIQAQHQMMVYQAPGCIIAALVGGNSLKLIPRKRNHQMEAIIRNKIRRFWDRVDNNNPPSPDYNKDYDLIMEMNKAADNHVYDATEDRHISKALKKYDELKKSIKSDTNAAKAIKAEVIHLIGTSCNKVIADGVSLNCAMTKGSKPYRQFKVNVNE